MARPNIIAGGNRLKHAIKVLRDQWLAVEPAWSDAVRRRFEERFIFPIDPAGDAALIGMQKLGDVLDQIRRDCSDRSEAL
jgi:hypothetical protein